MATFITLAECQIEVSAQTTARLLDGDGDGVIDPAAELQRREDACAHVVSLIHGAKADIPAAADAPAEWKRLARRWFLAQLAVDFPEYFRFDGMKLSKEIDREIAQCRLVEPAENLTYVASATSPDWDCL